MNKNTDIYDVELPDHRHLPMVLEVDYARFLIAAKKLVQDQRKALRTSNKEAIKDCKERERALLDFVTMYEAWREKQLRVIPQ